MHTKKLSWSQWLAILIVISLVAAIFFSHRHGSVSAKSKKIHQGMTYKEVVVIMGKPLRTPKPTAQWADEDGEFIVYFDDGYGTVENMQYESRQNLILATFRHLSDVFLD